LIFTLQYLKSLKSSTKPNILKHRIKVTASSPLLIPYLCILIVLLWTKLWAFQNAVSQKILAFLAQAQKWSDFKWVRLRILKRGKMLNLSEEVPTCHWRKTLGAARKVARLGEIAGLKRDNSKVCPLHLKVEMQRCQG
jgi:hypothetical protein